MKEMLYSSSDPLLETAILAVLVFFCVIIFVRIVGLRSFAKFTSYDFAFTVAFGSVIAAILTSSTTFVHGAVALAMLLGLTLIGAQLQKKFKLLKDVMENDPILLMDGSEILEENLEKCNVSRQQLMAKLREANVVRFSEVKAVILETTGDIAVLHGSTDKQIEDQILEGVRRS